MQKTWMDKDRRPGRWDRQGLGVVDVFAVYVRVCVDDRPDGKGR